MATRNGAAKYLLTIHTAPGKNCLVWWFASPHYLYGALFADLRTKTTLESKFSGVRLNPKFAAEDAAK